MELIDPNSGRPIMRHESQVVIRHPNQEIRRRLPRVTVRRHHATDDIIIDVGFGCGEPFTPELAAEMVSLLQDALDVADSFREESHEP